MLRDSRNERNGQAGLALKPNAKHFADLRASGLSDEQITACGFYSEADAGRLAELLHWKDPAKKLGSCLVIPFSDADGQDTGYRRVKPDRPRVNGKDRKPTKYESPRGASNRAYFPPGTRAALKDPSAPLLITEGEKKAAKADQEGFPCIGNVGIYGWQRKRGRNTNGTPQGPRELILDLAGIAWPGRRVYICYDSDVATNKNVRHARREFAATLARHGAIVHFISLPAGPADADGKPAKVGLDDFLIADGADAFRKLVEKALVFQESDEADGARPLIKVSTEEHVVNDAAVAALANDHSIYQRGGSLVRLIRDSSPAAANGIRRPVSPRIEEIPRESLRELMTRNARFLVSRKSDDGHQERPARPPTWCINGVHARRSWPGVRHLEAVLEYPVLRPDGTILQTAGYDWNTGLFFLPASPSPKISESPSVEDARRACHSLLSVVKDFPFEEEMHRSAFLAALLTPPARFAFPGPAPLFLVDANVRGVGKGLLCDLVSLILTGERLSVTTYVKDEEELRKRITSIALSGDRLVLFDNVDGKFGNGTLDAALTSVTWKDRQLGVSRMIEVPLHMTWFATGNNVAIVADTARRVCPIRLESPLERPENRSDFENGDLRSYVRAHRSDLLAAVLTILRAYILARKPKQNLPPWGSFEGWSAGPRSIVTWLGLPDPGEARMRMQQQADISANAISMLLEILEKMDPSRLGKTAAELVKLAEGDEWPNLRDAIESLASKLDARLLGNKLKTHRRRVIGGLFLDHAGKERRAVRWTAYPAGEFQHREKDTHNTHNTHTDQGECGESGECSQPRHEITDWLDGQRSDGPYRDRF